MSAARHSGRQRLWRGSATAGLVGGLLVLSAGPAFAHASFPAASAFNNAPNPAGGTGVGTATPPYAAGKVATITLRAPFEQTEPFNGMDDTTVKVDVIVPAGWTQPTCGSAKKQVNNDSTNSTNQPGAVVAGWSCNVVTEAGHQVLRWAGPQVASAADSPQFFEFSVKTPSPTEQTTYNGIGGTEGFIVDQTYASGHTMHWIPNADYPGTLPDGATSSVAGGLARTVAAVTETETEEPTTEPTTQPTTPATPPTEVGGEKVGGELPHTGQSTAPLAGAGAALVLAGGGLLLALRRRQAGLHN